jgi:glutamyl-tRNA reductase
MSGIDHRTAGVAQREHYALSAARQRRVLAVAGENPEILGALVLSTCSRTEIYLSLKENASVDPFSLIGAENDPHESLSGRECFYHLVQTASGALSRIFGEDQIIAQVKDAVAFAREQRALDNVLEVFFRTGVACAKQIKTELRFPGGGANIAGAAAEVLRSEKNIRAVLVIGSGEIGRMAAQSLSAAGCEVTMTLRQYAGSQVSAPPGVKVIPYEERYERLSAFDAVLSATKSPHCTVLREKLDGISPMPRVFLDLAVPRDIDPAVGELPGVTLYDVDSVSDRAERAAARRDVMEAMRPVLESGYGDLLQWEKGRERASGAERLSHFPLFVGCAGRRALVVGGGKIAARRVAALSRFSFGITVVSPECREEIRALAESGRIELLERRFEDEDLDGAFLVVAATDSREVNHRAAVLAKHRGVFASIADCAGECTFFFPALAESGNITVGVCGDGSDHHGVAAAAKTIREVLHEKSSDHREP